MIHDPAQPQLQVSIISNGRVYRITLQVFNFLDAFLSTLKKNQKHI